MSLPHGGSMLQLQRYITPSIVVFFIFFSQPAVSQENTEKILTKTEIKALINQSYNQAGQNNLAEALALHGQVVQALSLMPESDQILEFLAFEDLVKYNLFSNNLNDARQWLDEMRSVFDRAPSLMNSTEYRIRYLEALSAFHSRSFDYVRAMETQRLLIREYADQPLYTRDKRQAMKRVFELSLLLFGIDVAVENFRVYAKELPLRRSASASSVFEEYASFADTLTSVKAYGTALIQLSHALEIASRITSERQQVNNMLTQKVREVVDKAPSGTLQSLYYQSSTHAKADYLLKVVFNEDLSKNQVIDQEESSDNRVITDTENLF